MTDLTKKELVSNLYDAFADKVAAEDKELKELHKYLTPAEQHDNLVIDITKAVKDAGWQVSPGILDALCKGGAELMTMDLDEEIIVPPAGPPVDEAGLRTDGPTLEEYVAAGYEPAGYPPRGYAVKASVPNPVAPPAAINAVGAQASDGDAGALSGGIAAGPNQANNDAQAAALASHGEATAPNPN